MGSGTEGYGFETRTRRWTGVFRRCRRKAGRAGSKRYGLRKPVLGLGGVPDVPMNSAGRASRSAEGRPGTGRSLGPWPILEHDGIRPNNGLHRCPRGNLVRSGRIRVGAQASREIILFLRRLLQPLSMSLRSVCLYAMGAAMKSLSPAGILRRKAVVFDDLAVRLLMWPRGGSGFGLLVFTFHLAAYSGTSPNHKCGEIRTPR